jgi:hypothetical protein
LANADTPDLASVVSAASADASFFFFQIMLFLLWYAKGQRDPFARKIRYW